MLPGNAEVAVGLIKHVANVNAKDNNEHLYGFNVGKGCRNQKTAAKARSKITQS